MAKRKRSGDTTDHSTIDTTLTEKSIKVLKLIFGDPYFLIKQEPVSTGDHIYIVNIKWWIENQDVLLCDPTKVTKLTNSPLLKDNKNSSNFYPYDHLKADLCYGKDFVYFNKKWWDFFCQHWAYDKAIRRKVTDKPFSDVYSLVILYPMSITCTIYSCDIVETSSLHDTLLQGKVKHCTTTIVQLDPTLSISKLKYMILDASNVALDSIFKNAAFGEITPGNYFPVHNEDQSVLDSGFRNNMKLVIVIGFAKSCLKNTVLEPKRKFNQLENPEIGDSSHQNNATACMTNNSVPNAKKMSPSMNDKTIHKPFMPPRKKCSGNSPETYVGEARESDAQEHHSQEIGTKYKNSIRLSLEKKPMPRATFNSGTVSVIRGLKLSGSAVDEFKTSTKQIIGPTNLSETFEIDTSMPRNDTPTVKLPRNGLDKQTCKLPKNGGGQSPNLSRKKQNLSSIGNVSPNVATSKQNNVDDKISPSMATATQNNIDNKISPNMATATQNNVDGKVSPNLTTATQTKNTDNKVPSTISKLTKPNTGINVNGHDTTKIKKNELKINLVGMRNLGNTCYMNSGIQCLVNTKPLKRLFLKTGLKINSNNPLGTRGRVTKSFATLVKTISTSQEAIDPNDIKYELSCFAPQFAGYEQHDAHELVAFLLDALHEDLDTLREKPYIEKKETNDPAKMDDIARESWNDHLRRNSSVIVDMFHGQLGSKIECNEASCSKVSISFDPFTFLSIPLHEEHKPSLRLNFRIFLVQPIVSFLKENSIKFIDRSAKHHRMREEGFYQVQNEVNCLVGTMEIDQNATLEEFYQGLKRLGVCNSTSEWNWIVTSMKYGKLLKIYHVSDKIPEPLVVTGEPIDVFQLFSEDSTASIDDLNTINSVFAQNWKRTYAKKDRMFYEQCIRYDVWISLGLLPVYIEGEKDDTMREIKHFPMLVPIIPNAVSMMSLWSIISRRIPCQAFQTVLSNKSDDMQSCIPGLQFVWFDTDNAIGRRWYPYEEWQKTTCEQSSVSKQQEEKSVEVYLFSRIAPKAARRFAVMLSLKRVTGEDRIFDIKVSIRKSFEIISNLMNHVVPSAKISTELTTLYDCLQLFTREEQLGEEDMWYCPECKNHRRAYKKLTIQKLPTILVIQLKRFRFDQGFSRRKIERNIDFPIDVLDMSPYSNSTRDKYKLYAVVNHSGSSEFGHYTAYARDVAHEEWYCFNDSSVSACDRHEIVSNEAYLLFYQRIGDGAK